MLIPLLISSLLSATSLVLKPEGDVDYLGDAKYLDGLSHSFSVPPRFPVHQGFPLPPAPLRRMNSIDEQSYPLSSALSGMDPYVSGSPMLVSRIVGASDIDRGSGITELARNVSVTSNMTDSQPFSQEDSLGSPTTRKPLSSPAFFSEEGLVYNLYNAVISNHSKSESCDALREMAKNEEDCIAKVAITVLHKGGHFDFGMTGDEVLASFMKIQPRFSLYQFTNPLLFETWHPLLKLHDLIRD